MTIITVDFLLFIIGAVLVISIVGTITAHALFGVGKANEVIDETEKEHYG